jgi:uncharacterized coiled-coil protein SlyX
MTENDYKNFIAVYQQKSADLFNQTIALEARVMSYNQLIEALKNKINEQNDEIEKLKAKGNRKTTKTDNSSSEEF